VRRSRLVAAATGLAAAIFYLVMATWAGRTGSLTRRPLLDGFGGTPPPYNWVSPPPSLASQNKPPSSGNFDVALNPQSGSEATVLSTDDGQASIALNTGSIPPKQGADSAKVTITPLAPDGMSRPPNGTEIAGNVYRMEARYQPGGDPVERLGQGAQVVLAYPAEVGGNRVSHQLLVSSDGRQWTGVEAVDSHAQLLIQATVSSLGYFAVGRPTGSGAKSGKSLGTILVYLLLGLLILPIVFFIIRTERRMRRERREIIYGRSSGKTPPSRKSRRKRGDASRRDPFRD
jgi:hypothetical protein